MSSSKTTGIRLSPGRRTLLRRVLAREGLLAGDPVALERRAGPHAPAPLSSGQERLWFLARLAPANPFYVDCTAVRLRGPLDRQALARGLQGVIGRHQILRTRFPSVDGWPVAQVEPSLEISIDFEDLSGTPGAAARHARVLEAGLEEAQRPMHLEEGPLVRSRLLRLDEEEHVLLLVLHHIVHDGWSMRLLLRELFSAHRALAAGEPDPTPPPPFQFADFAIWQQRRLPDVLREQLPYWLRVLAGELPVLRLPADRARPAVQSFRGAAELFTLAPPLTRALRALALGRGVTPFVALFAGFLVLLREVTGDEDLCVGTAAAGRTSSELEELIGFFVNTLVLRSDLGGDPSFDDLLERTQEVVAGATAHQEVPFERLVEELAPERDLGANPLFTVWFNLLPSPLPELPAHDLELELIDLDHRTARLELALILREEGDRLRGTLEYATDLYDQERMSAMVSRYVRILECAVERPDSRLSALAAVEATSPAAGSERADTARAPADADRSILASLLESARRTPHALAVAAGADELSYRELLERAERLAQSLERRGCGSDAVIGLAMARSVSTLAGILGIQLAGAAYLPLDPSYPLERLRFMIDEGGASLVLADRRSAARLPADLRPRLLVLDELGEEEREPRSAPSPAPARGLPDPESLAYVIFTSGSTGRPKGVMVSHRNLAYSTRARLRWYDRPATRFLVTASLSFDSSVAGLYWPLASGGAVVFPEEGSAGDPRALAALIAKRRVTHLCLLPSLWRLLLESADPARLASLEVVIAAGEALPPAVVDLHRRRLPSAELVNEYGPTEATVWCCAHRVGDDGGGERVPIGRALEGTELLLLDGALQPVGAGAEAEIFVAGPGVARGYLRRPDLTAERFLPDPRAGGAGGRMYRTGDRGRRRADGTIELLGRCDDQVKIRGYRVEPAEVEAALEALDGVREAAVARRESAQGDGSLIAYVASTAPAPAPGELRRRLERRLPAFLVPDRLVAVEALPRTPNGKLDRAALAALDAGAAAPPAEHAAPSTPVERRLARLWSEVLGVERVGRDDSFFEIGGNSLRAAVVVGRLCAEMGDVLDLETHLRWGTLREIALQVERRSADGACAPAPPAPLPTADEALLAGLEGLSDAEVDEKLRELLRGEEAER
ncbi:MAG TPA: amino acid adenylation domain-containing protein [Thermoanaerobaculia bacterium]|nr:amino acid adenylation domain-containing protein [Thermoanaerobaculia bacterium]